MKLFFTLLFSSISMLFFAQKEEYTLTVKITSIENQRGVIEIALYNDPNKFPKIGQTYKIVRVKPQGNTIIHEFKNLTEGKYAVCLFHDENNNKTCDRNFFGIPTEAYAFLNNIRPKFSAPSFEECSTKLDKHKTVTIKMVY
ncbi:MAG: DUF2141 domain-containing protein [Flavobacteriales bacterium]|nr:DUF2141 domain-containing protein [Flavobacteriales bacterium]